MLSLFLATLIPLKAEAATVKDYMVKTAESYNIAPELIEAVIERESMWEEDAVNGNCIGLMQVNGNIHKDRMWKLGVKDLKDPRGNILVGVDLIAELFAENSDPYYVLMVYNEGYKAIPNYEKGKYSKYATCIIKRSEELEREHKK